MLLFPPCAICPRLRLTRLVQMVLKRPHAIPFSKKNEVHPFEPTGVQSLEFWSTKNDATFFVVGTNTKKR
jgi:ribosome production factor 2